MGGKLFDQQWNDPLNRFNLLKLLTHFMKMLGASFCILEPGWARRSRTDEDIKKWLHDINQGFARDWELVVLEAFFTQSCLIILYWFCYKKNM